MIAKNHDTGSDLLVGWGGDTLNSLPLYALGVSFLAPSHYPKLTNN